MLRVVLCPHPPLLLPGVGGAADPLADLRAEAVGAVRSQLRELSAQKRSPVHLVGAGGDRWPGSSLPLSLAVGGHLLDLAGWAGERHYHELPDVPSLDDLDDGLVILLGDGSARRGERAPGHLDARAEEFDTKIEKALADGDFEVLAGLDAGLGTELMAAGTEALMVLGGWGRVLGVAASELEWADAPFGVAYWVATWELGR